MDKDEYKDKSDDVSEESETARETKALKKVFDCKKDSMDFYDQKFKLFNYFDRLYIKGSAKSNVPYGRANLELPLAFQQVEPFVSQMAETMVGEAPYIAYEGRTADDEKPAQEITEFSQYQLEVGNFVPQYMMWLRNLAKYGTAVMKMAWEVDAITIKKPSEKLSVVMVKDPETGQKVPKVVMVPSEVEEEIVKHDGPVFYNLSIFDFFVPRSASSPDVQKMEWVIHRTYRTYGDLLRNPNYSKGKKKLLAHLDKEEDDFSAESGPITEPSKLVAENQKNPSRGSDKYKDKVEVLEWWGDFKLKADEPPVPTLIVIAICGNTQILLRMEENPLLYKFKPFLMSNDYPIEGEAYGYGELNHIKGLIEESTALRNARLDVANLSLNRTWLVERQSGVNARELYSAPNNIIWTNDLNGIRQMDMAGVTPSSVNELARIDFDIQNTTEIINPRQDVSNVGAAFGGTATGVNFLAAKTNLRLLTKARLMEETFFKPLAQMLNWYNKDFIEDQVYFRLRGEDKQNPYRSIGPDAFATPVDFKPVSNPQKLSTAEKKENMGYFLQTVGQIMKVRPNVNVKVEYLLQEIAKQSGFKHPSEVIGPSQTTIIQTPDGQILDSQGQPVQVMQVDESGQVIQPPPAGVPNGQ
jgi:hypothetical protein